MSFSAVWPAEACAYDIATIDNAPPSMDRDCPNRSPRR
jgi:hypothetical protein